MLNHATKVALLVAAMQTQTSAIFAEDANDVSAAIVDDTAAEAVDPSAVTQEEQSPEQMSSETKPGANETTETTATAGNTANETAPTMPASAEGAPAVAETAPTAPVPLMEAASLPDRFIANGERISVAEKGISIVPPTGWEVHANVSGSTLLFQVPKQPGMVYQRTIQVMAFSGARPMDQMTEEDFANEITKNFSGENGMSSGYQIHNRQSVELENGTKGILFYAGFNMGDVPMMQMHILVSSRDRHYLMTYTDLAEHFDSDKNSGYLDAAYSSLISAQVDSNPPMRFEATVMIFVGLGLFMALLGVIRLLQVQRSKKFRDEAEKDSSLHTHDHEDGEASTSAVSAISQIEAVSAPAEDFKSEVEEEINPKSPGKARGKPTPKDHNVRPFKSAISVVVAQDEDENEDTGVPSLSGFSSDIEAFDETDEDSEHSTTSSAKVLKRNPRKAS